MDVIASMVKIVPRDKSTIALDTCAYAGRRIFGADAYLSEDNPVLVRRLYSEE